MTNYTTRDLTKFLALCVALSNGGFDIYTLSHGGANLHHHIQTNADATQWAVVRASINIPSSAPSNTLPDPNTVVIPDTLPSEWS